jgi:uncharacterized protein (TIGR03118 family)
VGAWTYSAHQVEQSIPRGVIAGWSPAVSLTHAVVAVTRSGAVYKGLAIASTAVGDFLYAADFHNARVDVFNDSFGLVTAPGAFVDPKLTDGFAPFGITNIGGQIFVAYAKQDADQEDEVAGQGLGFVDAFDTGGNFPRRRVSTAGGRCAARSPPSRTSPIPAIRTYHGRLAPTHRDALAPLFP